MKDQFVVVGGGVVVVVVVGLIGIDGHACSLAPLLPCSLVCSGLVGFGGWDEFMFGVWCLVGSSSLSCVLT